MSEKGRPLFYIEADKILYKEEDGEHKFYIRLENIGDSAAVSMRVLRKDKGSLEIDDQNAAKRALKLYLDGPLKTSIIKDGEAIVLCVKAEYKDENGEDIFSSHIGADVTASIEYYDLHDQKYSQIIGFTYSRSMYGRVDIMEAWTYEQKTSDNR